MPEIAAQTEKDRLLDQTLSSALPADAPRNDLGSLGLVKKKKPAAASTSTSTSTGTKRKAEEEVKKTNGESSKKSRVEDVPE